MSSFVPLLCLLNEFIWSVVLFVTVSSRLFLRDYSVYSGHAMAATARQARAVIIRDRLLRLVALIVAIPAEHVLSASCALHPLTVRDVMCGGTGACAA